MIPRNGFAKCQIEQDVLVNPLSSTYLKATTIYASVSINAFGPLDCVVAAVINACGWNLVVVGLFDRLLENEI